MAADHTILHLVKKKSQNLTRIMACTLLSLSFAPGYDIVQVFAIIVE
jgi:hypothetical protein